MLCQFDMPIEEHASGKNMYWHAFKAKSKKIKSFDFLQISLFLSHQPYGITHAVNQAGFDCAGQLSLKMKM